jgi:hypothetical protein
MYRPGPRGPSLFTPIRRRRLEPTTGNTRLNNFRRQPLAGHTRPGFLRSDLTGPTPKPRPRDNNPFLFKKTQNPGSSKNTFHLNPTALEKSIGKNRRRDRPAEFNQSDPDLPTPLSMLTRPRGPHPQRHPRPGPPGAGPGGRGP